MKLKIPEIPKEMSQWSHLLSTDENLRNCFNKLLIAMKLNSIDFQWKVSGTEPSWATDASTTLKFA